MEALVDLLAHIFVRDTSDAYFEVTERIKTCLAPFALRIVELVFSAPSKVSFIPLGKCFRKKSLCAEEVLPLRCVAVYFLCFFLVCVMAIDGLNIYLLYSNKY